MNFLKDKNKKLRLKVVELPWAEPVEWFKKVNLPSYFFLDSAAASKTSKNSRWSYLSISPPRITFNSSKNIAEITYCGEKTSVRSENPIELLSEILESCEVKADDCPVPFKGGAVGYISYEYSRQFEKVPSRNKRKAGLPECFFTFPERYLAFDTLTKKVHFVIISDKGINIEREKNLAMSLFESHYTLKDFCLKNCTSNFNLKSFSKAVEKVKKYISAGDIFQANIAQRWSGDFSGDSKTVYLNLRKINPSPYACYLKFPGVEIISCSPELLLRRRGDIIETRPIAGTRRRGRGADEDKLLKAELLLDDKEKAEHIMLVDLERNDLGKISKFNSVRITEDMTIEQYSHVSHIVSNVRGRLRGGVSTAEIIRAIFPGGTITGCPKIRAMEIIDEIEPVERGPYCGSAGWISYDGNMDLNILIRTIIKSENKVSFYAGAGIVADSIPEREYKETIHKARALAESLRCII